MTTEGHGGVGDTGRRAEPEPVVVTPPLLRDRGLPEVGATTDKASRGQVVVVGGGDRTAGAVLLAGVAALRAGAGKLRLASGAAVAPHLGIVVPEAMVAGLPCDHEGSIDAAAARPTLERVLRHSAAVLVGPGTLDPDASGELLDLVLALAPPDAALVVDAAALAAVAAAPERLGSAASRVVLMPNPTEAADLLGGDDGGPDADAVDRDPVGALGRLVARYGCTVALRAPDTLIAGPGTAVHLDRSGHPALGTSGSGDVLGGVLTGLLARGADPLTATLWAVHVHGRAGEQAAYRVGGLGVLARELLDEVAPAMAAIGGRTT